MSDQGERYTGPGWRQMADDWLRHSDHLTYRMEDDAFIGKTPAQMKMYDTGGFLMACLAILMVISCAFSKPKKKGGDNV